MSTLIHTIVDSTSYVLPENDIKDICFLTDYSYFLTNHETIPVISFSEISIQNTKSATAETDGGHERASCRLQSRSVR